MTFNFPSTRFYSLEDLDCDINRLEINISQAIIDQLHSNTLTSIKNAFKAATSVWENGSIYINVEYLGHLLRTGNSGAANFYWRQGIEGLVSPSNPYTINNGVYISSADFCGLVDARLRFSTGKTRVYLEYIRAIYHALSSNDCINSLRNIYVSNVESQRNTLKSDRIRSLKITRCEFSGQYIKNCADIEFSHIESVSTNPMRALDINNGVIILKSIHREITNLCLHDFASIYDFCEERGYSTLWADNFKL
ncbi:hypothetical protein NKW43_05775 [Gluconobacter albidus]|uniref:hypothetical protein n=1 Tax=Gluconobacter albidus TaxID=318683 RepID=UPI00209DBB38|nr:hypothetical protein [Gluconobacter albidus]MCP1273193.1 hypothetical protein [Gluconobacter albidus]